MGVGSGPPCWESVIHHGVDELLIKQHSVPGREIILSTQEGTQHAHPLNSFLSNLIDVRRPGESFI